MLALERQRQFSDRVVTLEEQVHSNPKDLEALQTLALSYVQLGSFGAQQLEVINRASDAFPADVRLQRAVSFGFVINQGQQLVRDAPSLEDIDSERLEKAVVQLKKLSARFDDSADIHRAIGDILLIRGDYRDSLRHYKSAIALGLDSIEHICSHFELLDNLYPMPPDIIAFFAELYQRIGRHNKAHGLYQRLIKEGEMDPETLGAFYRFISSSMGYYQHDRPAYETFVREASRVALMLGRTSEALEWARGIDPDALAEDPDLIRSLGRHLIDNDDYRLAFDYLSSIPLDQETKQLINEMAVRHEQRGELDTATYLLQYINENDMVAGGGRRKAPQTTGQSPGPGGTDRFAPDGQGGVQRSPEWEIEVNTQLQLAELHWKNRRWLEAFETYLRLLEIGYDDYRSILEPLDSLLERLPDISEQHLAFLANYFAEQREWRRTLFYAERALYLDPTMDDIRQRLIQACEQILLQDPDACEVRLKIGDMFLERSNIERAMKEYRKAAGYPEFGMKAKRRIAVALHKAGDLKAAFDAFEALPLLETEDLENLYDLMISLQNEEQWKLAHQSAILIKDFDPKFRDVEHKIEEFEARMAAAGRDDSVDPRMRELIGDHSIGRYKYIEKIGSGGMGVVHKILDLKTNHEVAMKILREGLSSSDKAIDRFFREARIAATLHHENIVNILDYNISNTYGQSYIAMEYVDGPSLRDVVEDKFAQDVDVELDYVIQVIDWMVQTCNALEATHQKGIIHRDIKPDNIMLTSTGFVKLTDFGIVHIEEATFTPTGALIGTPRYMSPEQVHGGRIDARSDIYAVGIILYEMLIGSPPFISGDISYQQVNVIPTNPREICQVIPVEVDAIIMKCLEKTPEDRFASAEQLRQGLEYAYVRVGGNADRFRVSDVPSSIDTSTNYRPPSRPGTPSTPPIQSRAGNTSLDLDSFDSELDLGGDTGVDRERVDRIVRRPSQAGPINSDPDSQTVDSGVQEDLRRQTSPAIHPQTGADMRTETKVPIGDVTNTPPDPPPGVVEGRYNRPKDRAAASIDSLFDELDLQGLGDIDVSDQELANDSLDGVEMYAAEEMASTDKVPLPKKAAKSNQEHDSLADLDLGDFEP